MNRFPIVPYPNSWYQICWSDELSIGKIKSFRFFGKDIVSYRTSDGTPHVFDAYCPHMGAHLGAGKINQDLIQCPFHGWCFNAEGRCANIPYTEELLDHARLKKWRCADVNGMILVYYNSENKDSDFSIPKIQEYDAEDWESAGKMNFRFKAALMMCHKMR